jgi:uncharacterized protein (DUF1800 family)
MCPSFPTPRSGFAGPSRWAAALAALLLLAACGSDGGGTTAVADPAASAATATTAPTYDAALLSDFPASRAQAARFLNQATFGATAADIDLVTRVGYSAWIDAQWALPATSHRAYWDAADALARAATPPATAGQNQILESFWKQAVNGPDQLRLRVVFALSQIFVISSQYSDVLAQPRGQAAWLDMLGDKGPGSYRQLLKSVSLNPMMGLYLSSIRNRKADAIGRVPDENYAREVMQLFSIGLVRLNADGTPLLVDGNAVETYGPADIAGMARVFTGWGWSCPDTGSNCFGAGNTGGSNPQSDPDWSIKPMMAYPAYHSTEAKSFLGVTIPAQATADPAASLKVALDTLDTHPNTAPFISRQLIQRLVTSNPSPAYVQAVAAVFDTSRPRGDLKAVVKAILTHPEARIQNDTQGKLREPVLRLSAYLRAFPHQSDTGSWKVGNTDNAASSLGQTPLGAASVFNFYRPGYVAPGTRSAAAGLVTPEMQLLNETSAAGWVNFMRDNLASGIGQTNATVNGVALNRRDLQRDWSAELALAANPADLVLSVTDRLLAGQATDALRSDIATTLARIAIPALNSAGTNQAAIDAARRTRVNAAVLLTLASPEFLVQR